MTQQLAVIYARVSSREQQQEGYSIDAQLKLARAFAAKNGFEVEQEFVDIESAKSAGRREFGNMVDFLSRSTTCRTILVEKTDRLSRNFEDQVLLNKLDLEIHFVKTGTVLSKNAKAQGRTYDGTHPTFISRDLFGRAQDVLHGHNKPKYRKHDIAFRGLLTCAHDDCTVTAELKKNKYVYYRCSGGRGPCELPRFREEEISERLASVLKDVSLPAEVARAIESSLERQQDEMRKVPPVTGHALSVKLRHFINEWTRLTKTS